MCFASDIDDIDVGQMNMVNRFLFNEEVGVVIEVSDKKSLIGEKQLFGLLY